MPPRVNKIEGVVWSTGAGDAQETNGFLCYEGIIKEWHQQKR